MDGFDYVAYIKRVRELGFDPESHPKNEVKREWYKFGDPNPVVKTKVENEFVKDLTAIANTSGPTGYLIIGLDKNGIVTHSPFSESRLRDISDLQKMVVKKVDEPVYFNIYEELFKDDDGTEKAISILEIPPSITKPHVIRNYTTPSGHQCPQFIPVRKGSNVNPATKSDIEYMIYDRKNIVPDYALDILTHNPTLNLTLASSNDSVELSFQLILQNYGKKPIGIVAGTLELEEESLDDNGRELKFGLKSYFIDTDPHSLRIYLKDRFITIGSNRLVPMVVSFNSVSPLKPEQINALRQRREISFKITLQNIVGKLFQSDRLQGNLSTI